MAKKKTYYYIDASALVTQDFYLLLERLMRDESAVFLLDSELRREIEGDRRLGAEWDALAMESFVDLLASIPGSMQVNTCGGFDPSVLTPFAREGLVVLTTRRRIFESFRTLGEKVSFFRPVAGDMEPFVDDYSENLPSYWPEQDVYVNPFDAEQLDTVYSPRYGYLKLDKSSGYSGGEGVCYRSYNGLLCKIYFKKHITYVNYKKLQAMVEMGCSTPYISWPLDILYYRNQFVGYVMEELTDTRSVDELRDDNFSGFRILDRFIIVRNFLSIIEYLHERKILVGDMKLDNILVKPSKEVYLIDAGSFQVEDYPCDVCHKEYTERIYTGDDLKHILRCEREEYFPINKIIFEMLMLKNPFYSRNNTEIDGDGSREFSYPLELPQDASDLPYHLRVWYALSPNMRRYFHSYFTEGKLTHVSEWLRELDLYILARERAMQQAQNQA